MTDPLVAALAAAEHPHAVLGEGDVRRWRPGALAALEQAGVLAAAEPAGYAECDSCGRHHVEPVAAADHPGRPRRWYVLCPTDGRVWVDRERLRRWAVRAAGFGAAVAGAEPTERLPERVWALGPIRLGDAVRVGWLVAGWRGEAGLAERVPELIQPTAVVFVPHDLPPAAVWGSVAPPVLVPLIDVLALTDAGLTVNPDALAAYVPTAPNVSSPAEPAVRPPLAALPSGTTWEQVTLAVEDHHLTVRAGGTAVRVGYEAGGFADGRSGAPNHLWRVLTLLAERGGVLDDGDGVYTKSSALKQNVRQLRTSLKRLTGLTDDPFHPTGRGRPYRLRSRISLATSSDR